jgi:aminopeptidase N
MKPFTRALFGIVFLLLCAGIDEAQTAKFTRQDTLRGTITKEREWWDLKYYHLEVNVNPADSSLKGKNLIQYKVLKPYNVMQVDLQNPLNIISIKQDGKQLEFTREGNAFFVKLLKPQKKGSIEKIIVEYSGRPRISRNPPWSGGLSWKKDSENNPYISTTCQGDGASIWWPCKDHQYDETDSMLISVTVPNNLMDVSNGRLRKTTRNNDNTITYDWFVSCPINNYCVNMNIGAYVHFSEQYKGEKGILDCDYYVLKENLEKAKVQFQEVKRMLAALEHWFGPYPFYKDSYKLVDVSYTGMEHQSSVTYGNGYKNGYRGRDESRTGWGMKFDFIIVHESSHEWFGNNITSKDIADMWIHESFGAYSESLFTDFHFGKQAGNEYLIGTRKNIRNDRPIIGPYYVNREGSGDMYSKGANMLHTIRQVVDNDEKFRGMLRGLSKEFYHKTVTTEQVEKYIAKYLKLDLTSFFNQYLRTTKIPVFEYSVEGTDLKYRWSNCVDGFSMPVKIKIGETDKWVAPSFEWKSLKILSGSIIKIDPNFYITAKNLNEQKSN